jgi:2,3-diketo-5-methylthio-1-phosphopentane phosphatase
VTDRDVVIVSDFDGTIAERDVGHYFFSTFIPQREEHEELLEKWRLGLISSRECLEREIEMVEADIHDLDRFIEGERFDPFFKDFVDFCERRGFELLVVSDGLDYYIEALLMRFGLGYLEMRANHLVLDGSRIAGIEFPWYDPVTCSMCGNCKKLHVLEQRGAGRLSVYVGNGLSDRCASGHADIVFAKGELLDHCRKEGIDCLPWRNFRDVERELTSRLLL